MSDDNTIHATMWLMVLVQTIGSVDMPGKGERKLPSPRAYVAIVITWTILGFIANIGIGFRRLVSRLSWLLLLIGMVAGPFGTRSISFLQTIASTFSIAPPSTPNNFNTPGGGASAFQPPSNLTSA